MPWITVRDVATHYQQLGQQAVHGRDIVAVHGLASDLSFWYLGAGPLLARHHRVTLYDLRGHGLSGSTSSGYSSAALARDLLSLIDLLGLDRPVLIGHSYGAAIALHAATLAPDRAAAVVIADGYLPCFDRVPTRRTAKPGSSPGDLPRVAYRVLEEIGRPGPDGSAIRLSGLRRWTQLRADSSVATEVADRSLTADGLAGQQLPWLAVYGTHSPCRATLAGLQRLRPDLETIAVPGGRHLHPYRQPQFFDQQVERFLHRLGAAPAPAAAVGARDA